MQAIQFLFQLFYTITYQKCVKFQNTIFKKILSFNYLMLSFSQSHLLGYFQFCQTDDSINYHITQLLGVESADVYVASCADSRILYRYNHVTWSTYIDVTSKGKFLPVTTLWKLQITQYSCLNSNYLVAILFLKIIQTKKVQFFMDRNRHSILIDMVLVSFSCFLLL